MATLYRRFLSLGGPDRRLVLEAASLMAAVSIGIRILRVQTLRRFLDPLAHASPRVDTAHSGAATIDRVRWAVTAVRARFPWATCLVQAIAADILLRRRGVACELRIGVRPASRSTPPLEAHAWVDCGGVIAIGDTDNLSTFELLALRSPSD